MYINTKTPRKLNRNKSARRNAAKKAKQMKRRARVYQRAR